MYASSVEFFKQLNFYGVRCQVEIRRVRSRVGLRADRYPGLRKPENGGHPAYSGALLAQTVQII